MSDWKDIKLDDYIVDIAAGPFGSNLKVECFVSSGFPIIDGANLKEVKVTDNITKFVTEEKARSLHRSIAKRNDVVVTISGNVGQISYIPLNSKYEEYLVSQRQFRVTFDTQKIYVPFLVYYFHSLEGQHKILSFANQTGVPALAQPLKNFKNIIIPLPNIKEQKRIASILVALDNKIENNRRIIANLEQQSQALFKFWFIDFEPFKDQPFVESELGMIPQGWKVLKLEDIATLNAGGDKPNLISKAITEICKVPVYSNGLDEEGLYGYTNEPRINDRAITVSARGTIGDVNLRLEPYCPIVRLISVIPKIQDNLYYIYYALKNQTIEGVGTTQQQLTVPIFKKKLVLMPSELMIGRFTDFVKTLILRSNGLKQETCRLAELRDTLLPRLMSGELRVPDTDLINEMLEKGIR